MIRRKERRPHCLLDRDRLGGEAQGQSGESLHPGFKRFQILQKNIQILQKKYSDFAKKIFRFCKKIFRFCKKDIQILQKNIQILQKIFIFYLGNPRWKAVICLWRGALGSTAVTNQINKI